MRLLFGKFRAQSCDFSFNFVLLGIKDTSAYSGALLKPFLHLKLSLIDSLFDNKLLVSYSLDSIFNLYFGLFSDDAGELSPKLEYIALESVHALLSVFDSLDSRLNVAYYFCPSFGG